MAFLITFAMTSCDFFGGSTVKPDLQDTNISAIDDSIKNKIIKQDSLYRGLVELVETLTDTLNTCKSQVAKLQLQVKKQKEPSWIWLSLTIVSLLLGVFAIAEILSSRGVYLRKEEVEKLIKEKLSKEKQSSNFENYIRGIIHKHPNSNTAKSVDANDFRRISDRLNSVEKKIEELRMPVANSGNYIQQASSKVIYAKLNTNEYFMEVQDHAGDGCVFRIESNSPDTGTFNIISIDKIKSKDALKSVVECHGCKMSEAQHFKVMSLGECQKVDGVWKMTKKLEIEISK